ncbi:MAG: hypothetical protein AABW85_04315 [archaeon]
MSLITLTFGDKQKANSYKFKEVSKPLDAIKTDETGKLEVKKINQFFGERNVYVIGEVTSGVLSEQMKAKFGEKTCLLVEVESKVGNKAKKGMHAGLMLAGIEKEDVAIGQVIDFSY